jgi:hypothetical protein
MQRGRGQSRRRLRLQRRLQRRRRLLLLSGLLDFNGEFWAMMEVPNRENGVGREAQDLGG